MIDIIIPTYNSTTLDRTLKSICMQTIKDKATIYIIDDGSVQTYDELVEKFKSRLNIKLLKLNQNMGPGFARNYGMEHSNSKYIMFMDSDDMFVTAFSLENLYKVMINNDLAVGRIIDEQKDNFKYYENHIGCLHGKMYSRSFLEKYNFKFNKTRNHEDHSFHRLVLLAKPQIGYTKEDIYLYKYTDFSITNKIDFLEDIKLYLFNMNWIIKNALLRNFDFKEIEKIVFSTLIYAYQTYIYNYEQENIDLILLYSKSFYEYHLKYKNLLTQADKKQIHDFYPCEITPPISFEEFLKKVNVI